MLTKEYQHVWLYGPANSGKSFFVNNDLLMVDKKGGVPESVSSHI